MGIEEDVLERVPVFGLQLSRELVYGNYRTRLRQKASAELVMRVYDHMSPDHRRLAQMEDEPYI